MNSNLATLYFTAIFIIIANFMVWILPVHDTSRPLFLWYYSSFISNRMVAYWVALFRNFTIYPFFVNVASSFFCIFLTLSFEFNILYLIFVKWPCYTSWDASYLSPPYLSIYFFYLQLSLWHIHTIVSFENVLIHLTCSGTTIWWKHAYIDSFYERGAFHGSCGLPKNIY